MKQITRHILVPLFTLFLVLPGAHASDWMDGMKEGKPALKSIGPLAFGPDGILFVADTKGAAVIAIATSDTTPAADAKPLKVEGINQKIAGLLGRSDSHHGPGRQPHLAQCLSGRFSRTRP